MKKQNFQYLTWLIVLGGVLYAVGAINVFATFFSENPGNSYSCSEYGYVSGYGYGYDCTLRTGGWSSSIGWTSSTTTTDDANDDTTTDDANDDTTTDDASDDTTTDDSSDDNSSDTEGSTESPYAGDKEIVDAYEFGFENGLTTLPLEEARLYDGLNRSELAKMMSNFIKNVDMKEAVDNPVCDITTYSDYATFDDEMKMYIKMACDYGIMGWKNDKSWLIEAFRPLDPVTREEFAAVLSRHLFGSEHDGKDMVAHLEALKDAGIMNQIDNPYVVEVRGYVLLMLQRAMEEAEADEALPTEEETTTEDEAMTETGTVAEDEAMTETGTVVEETGTGTEA